MNRLLQDGLIGLYGLVKKTGALDTPAGRKLFEASYGFYKDRLEAGPILMLRPYVRPGSWVIDVGANIGFFTRRFASWVSQGGKVIAVRGRKGTLLILVAGEAIQAIYWPNRRLRQTRSAGHRTRA